MDQHRTSVVSFETRRLERFLNLAHEVRLHARPHVPHEAADVEQLVRNVKAGAMPARDGHALLVGLRHDQRRDSRAA